MAIEPLLPELSTGNTCSFQLAVTGQAKRFMTASFLNLSEINHNGFSQKRREAVDYRLSQKRTSLPVFEGDLRSHF
jgi:hypothetical protein